ncbi:MAG: phosphoribosyltransferase family protein [Actinomycetes bacterium]
MTFADRADAGRQLATRLGHLRGRDLVVLGLPRGGVPVASQVARALGAPLDVLVVRKLGVPFQPELAMGAVGEGGVRVLNESVMEMARITPEDFGSVERNELREMARRVARFRGERPRVDLDGRTALVVDDGIATGATARAACQVARAQGAARVILAAPVAPLDQVDVLRDCADEVVFLETPGYFLGVGQFYEDFSQTTDDEVATLLERAHAPVIPAARTAVTTRPPASRLRPADDPPGRDEQVEVQAGQVRLPGRLTVPEGSEGLVVFVHGSGSSRHSPRNRFVASVLNRATLGTLLFDLLTPDEEYDRANVFHIQLLAARLAAATTWLKEDPLTRDLHLGYFGASTGAAAALWAAAEPGCQVAAIVSRGGRPDLAAVRLGQVRAPTLLIVGGRDEVVLDLNREAQARLRCESQLAVVPGATHLFEEPGTLEAAAGLATDWLVGHLTTSHRVG